MRGPTNGVDRASVAAKLSHREHRNSNVKNDYLILVHDDCCKIVRVLLVPSYPQKR
jgi:hypothetical protein